ncbi:32659_t:CDS:2, partial [Racocetra persica]
LWQSINQKFEYFKQELYSSRPIFTVGNNETEINLLDDYTKTKTSELLKVSEVQVNERIKTSRGRLLPGFIPSSVAESLIKKTNLNWRAPAINYLNSIYFVILKLVNKSVDDTFSRFPNLVGQISDFHEVLKRENQEPTSTLEIMALVMAYFKIALNRYVDIIAMTIIHTFIDQFTKHIEERMIGICVLDGKFQLDEMIKEDDSIKHQRDYLTNLEKNLKESLDNIVKFGI